MISALKLFEKFIVITLVTMLGLVVALTTLELGWLIVQDVITPPVFLLEINELLDIFGMFLMVLIGMELLDTIKTYLDDRTLHIEVVLMVAMIAIARKVIILDEKELSANTLLGIGAIIVALGIGYYLLKLVHRETGKTDKS